MKNKKYLFEILAFIINLYIFLFLATIIIDYIIKTKNNISLSVLFGIIIIFYGIILYDQIQELLKRFKKF
jgi:hypothetical protein